MLAPMCRMQGHRQVHSNRVQLPWSYRRTMTRPSPCKWVARGTAVMTRQRLNRMRRASQHILQRPLPTTIPDSMR
eukprot:151896-Amphidinium_carterae.1